LQLISDFVRNADILSVTEQPFCFSAVSSRRLSPFVHMAHIDGTADANQIFFEPC